jgi:hypothetical protein
MKKTLSAIALSATMMMMIGFQAEAMDAAVVPIRGAEILVLRGTIEIGDDTAVKHVLATQPSPGAVLLESEGGNVYAALGIADLVEALDIPVVVGAWCASACAIIALENGRKLHVVQQGGIAVHTIYDRYKKPEYELTRQVALRLKKHGVPRGILLKMQQTPPEDNYVLSDAELRSVGAQVDAKR